MNFPSFVSPDIFPKEIKLIKTKANHYGQSVYYTRENCIVIPYNELDQRNEQAFLNVMIHELFPYLLSPQSRQAKRSCMNSSALKALVLLTTLIWLIH